MRGASFGSRTPDHVLFVCPALTAPVSDTFRGLSCSSFRNPSLVGWFPSTIILMASRLPWSLLQAVLLHWMTLSVANAAFTFTFSTPTQCDNLSLTWSGMLTESLVLFVPCQRVRLSQGGQGPFSLQLIPILGTPRNISIPDSAFSNGKGSYETQLDFPATHQILLAMSDSTGFGAGGTTNVLTVGPSVGGSSCNTTDPGVDFTFELNDALQQCR
jgi:hypothetical protein